MTLNYEIYKTALVTEIQTAELYHTYSTEDYKLSKKFLYKFDKISRLWTETEESFVISEIARWLLTQQIMFTDEFNKKLATNNRDTILQQLTELTKNTKKVTSYTHLQKVYKFFTKFTLTFIY